MLPNWCSPYKKIHPPENYYDLYGHISHTIFINFMETKNLFEISKHWFDLSLKLS